jgi:hypothetical protein
MGDEPKVIKGRMEMAGLSGPLWAAGWLFTIGYLHLPVAKAIFALVIWPYYIGAALAR